MVGNEEDGVWRIFDEGSEVKRGMEMVENGGGRQTAACEQYLDRSPGIGERGKMGKLEERKRKTREDFGNL